MEFEEKCELLRNSLNKNSQEFVEEIVKNFDITSYKELINMIFLNHNVKILTCMKNQKLFEEVIKELSEQKA